MSSQKGNSHKNRSQKYQNTKAFKNNLHEKNKKALSVNSLDVEGCCSKCTEVIEWKIKYKKYKTLTTPKKCVRCGQKSVKRAYCIVCASCVGKLNICAKCTEEKDVVNPTNLSEEEKNKQMAQLEQELRLLSERKRRTFLRLQASGKLTDGAEACAGGRGDADDSDEGPELTDSEYEEGSDTDCCDSDGDEEVQERDSREPDETRDITLPHT